jgi:hypothetical protein
MENPIACAIVNSEVCKSKIALYYMSVKVIRSGVCNQVLINPVIRTRTRLNNGVYHSGFSVITTLRTDLIKKSVRYFTSETLKFVYHLSHVVLFILKADEKFKNAAAHIRIQGIDFETWGWNSHTVIFCFAIQKCICFTLLNNLRGALYFTSSEGNPICCNSY